MNRNSALSSLALAVLALAVTAQSAVAAGTYVFSDRDDSSVFGTSFPNSQAAFNDFTSRLTSFGVDGAETAAGVNPPLTFGVTGITATTQGLLAQSAPGFQIGGQALLELDAAVAMPAVATAFTFNQPITAAGLFIIQGGDSGNNNPITFRLQNSVTSTLKDVTVQIGPGWGVDNIIFVGFGDNDGFDQLTLFEAGDLIDGMLYDNITAGFFVPEPSSLVLSGVGAVAAACFAVRRRRSMKR